MNVFQGNEGGKSEKKQTKETQFSQPSYFHSLKKAGGMFQRHKRKGKATKKSRMIMSESDWSRRKASSKTFSPRSVETGYITRPSSLSSVYQPLANWPVLVSTTTRPLPSSRFFHISGAHLRVEQTETSQNRLIISHSQSENLYAFAEQWVMPSQSPSPLSMLLSSSLLPYHHFSHIYIFFSPSNQGCMHASWRRGARFALPVKARRSRREASAFSPI